MPAERSRGLPPAARGRGRPCWPRGTLVPVPAGITPQSWRLLAIFAATITGSIVRPIPGAAIVLLGVTALPVFRVLTINEALTGYADPVMWLVLAAFFISRGMIKTGLGRRIAFLFIKAIGKHSLGLAYALGSTETVLATVIPSTGARSGGQGSKWMKGNSSISAHLLRDSDLSHSAS